MGLPTFLASALSGLVTAVGWVSQRMRSLNVTPRFWACVACQAPNELDRDTCWSCGEGYGQDPLYPSRIPFDRRWLCPACAVWNGIARTNCWRCRSFRDGGLPVPGTDAGQEPPRGTSVPGCRLPPGPQTVPRSGAGEGRKRRNS